MDHLLNLERDAVTLAHPAKPITVTPKTTVRDVFRQLREHRTGGVLICRDEVLLGIFTERDALRMMADGADLDAPIERVMVKDPVTLSSDDHVSDAVKCMSQGGYRRVPIVDDEGRPTGLVKVSGILHYLVEHFPETVYNLPPTPNSSPQTREGA